MAERYKGKLFGMKILGNFEKADLFLPVGWYRFIPFLGYHHVVMMLVTGSIVMTSMFKCSSRTTLW